MTYINLTAKPVTLDDDTVVPPSGIIATSEWVPPIMQLTNIPDAKTGVKYIVTPKVLADARYSRHDLVAERWDFDSNWQRKLAKGVTSLVQI